MLREDGPVAPPEAEDDAPRPRAVSARAPVVYVAGFWRRFLACVLDLALWLPLGWALAYLSGKIAGLALPAANHTGIDYWLDLALGGDPALWGGVLLVTAVGILYLLLFQATLGFTPGMRALGLVVIDVYGDPPGLWRAALRTGGILLGVLTFFLGILWMGFDREKRGLHDWIAGTYVIVAKKSGGAQPA